MIPFLVIQDMQNVPYKEFFKFFEAEMIKPYFLFSCKLKKRRGREGGGGQKQLTVKEVIGRR
jgi:hypothetical protein